MKTVDPYISSEILQLFDDTLRLAVARETCIISFYPAVLRSGNNAPEAVRQVFRSSISSGFRE